MQNQIYTVKDQEKQIILQELQTFRKDQSSVFPFLRARATRYRYFQGSCFLLSQKHPNKAVQVHEQQPIQKRIEQLIQFLETNNHQMPSIQILPKLSQLAEKLCQNIVSSIDSELKFKAETSQILRQFLNTDSQIKYPNPVTCLVSLGFNQQNYSLLNLLIDDGVQNRTNRFALLNQSFKYFGVWTQVKMQMRCTVYVMTDYIVDQRQRQNNKNLLNSISTVRADAPILQNSINSLRGNQNLRQLEQSISGGTGLQNQIVHYSQNQGIHQSGKLSNNDNISKNGANLQQSGEIYMVSPPIPQQTDFRNTQNQSLETGRFVSYNNQSELIPFTNINYANFQSHNYQNHQNQSPPNSPSQFISNHHSNSDQLQEQPSLKRDFSDASLSNQSSQNRNTFGKKKSGAISSRDQNTNTIMQESVEFRDNPHYLQGPQFYPFSKKQSSESEPFSPMRTQNNKMQKIQIKFNENTSFNTSVNPFNQSMNPFAKDKPALSQASSFNSQAF